MEDFTRMLGHMQEAQAKVQEIQQKLTQLQAQARLELAQ